MAKIKILGNVNILAPLSSSNIIQTPLTNSVSGTVGEGGIHGVENIRPFIEFDPVNVYGDVYIDGTIQATGSASFVNTTFEATSSLAITNTGTGPALEVDQEGDNGIAGFYDHESTIALWIDGDSARPGYVGVKTETPNEALTVVGSISATEIIHGRHNLVSGSNNPNFKGNYDPFIPYNKNDIVTYDGATWIYLKDVTWYDEINTENPRTSLYDNGSQTYLSWDLLVEHGATGDVGPTGEVNTTIASTGATGATGEIGIAGPTGSEGETGVESSTGVTGPTGDIGIQGETGILGNEGYRGPTGVQGSNDNSVGQSGVVGETGVTGPTGATGIAGSDNLFSGPEGYTGETGVTGPTGLTGYEGPTGYEGYVGPTGWQGAQSSSSGGPGSTGATGETGPTGVGGSLGIDGQTGETGPANNTVGDQGPTGQAGGSGDPGQTGETGQAGPNNYYTGQEGETGYKGVAGETGATGVEGINTGYSGNNGYQGPTGDMGATGEYGVTGVSPNGEAGISGPTGPTGDTGPLTNLEVGTISLAGIIDVSVNYNSNYFGFDFPESYVRKYKTTIGDGSSTAFVVNHNLNTSDAVISVKDTGSKQIISPFVAVEYTNDNNITVEFQNPPDSGQYEVTVLG